MLRQRFWSNYSKQYDTDDTGKFSHVEITSLLDSLGSTLSRKTINSWFARFKKEPQSELTKDELIQCLEEETARPDSEKRPISSSVDDASTAAPSGFTTPSLQQSQANSGPINFSKLDFSGPDRDFQRSPDAETFPDAHTNPGQPGGNTNVLGTLPVPAGPALAAGNVPQPVPGQEHQRQPSSSEEEDSEVSVERVINIKTCPLCNRPRLTAKGEMDIITHLAICASQDWEKVDRITVGNFVTASQAQRKWYTKALSKLSTGAYSIGAVSNSTIFILPSRRSYKLSEFCKCHRTESFDWSVGRREDARLCPCRYSSTLQRRP
jgi:phosphatidylserine decarboxylase